MTEEAKHAAEKRGGAMTSEEKYWFGAGYDSRNKEIAKAEKEADKWYTAFYKLQEEMALAHQQPSRCPGPRQHGHPLVYESHCDHGETKAHDIVEQPSAPTPGRKVERQKG